MTALHVAPGGGGACDRKAAHPFWRDRFLSGTESIRCGSPQDQIYAFRTFEITPCVQKRYGYPALTREVKRTIFGFTGARHFDIEVKAVESGKPARRREAYRESPNPSFRTAKPSRCACALARQWQQAKSTPSPA